MFKVKLKNKEYEVSPISENEIEVNGEQLIFDLATISATKSHIILNNKSYNIEIVSVNDEKKEITLKINNNPYTVSIKNQYDILLSKLGMSNLTTKVIKDVKAPMPGVVIETVVKQGDEVKEGNSLLILEAMKMENVIKSPINGKIKSIVVKPKDTVEKNQLLVEFE